jgi:hypothetical protein
VEENGMYQVTIFAIRGGRGIVDSTVEYMELLRVDDIPTTAAATTTTTTTSINSSAQGCSENGPGHLFYFKISIKCEAQCDTKGLYSGAPDVDTLKSGHLF